MGSALRRGPHSCCHALLLAAQRLQEQERIRTFLFTDRAIYRPGQPVFFKGLVVRGKGADHRWSGPDHLHRVARYAWGGRRGTGRHHRRLRHLHGTFTAPTGTLTGVMRLVEEHGSQAVRVEEYKPHVRGGLRPGVRQPGAG